MARGKQQKSAASKSAPKGKAKASAKAKVPARAAPKPKAAAKAAPKAAPKRRSPHHDEQETEHEPDDMELMLETLACPVATADRLWSVCEGALEGIHDDIGGVSAAQLVWRGQPSQPVLGAAVDALAEELIRHAQVLIDLMNQLQPLAEAQDDHNDLDPPEVLERLRPLMEEAPALEE